MKDEDKARLFGIVLQSLGEQRSCYGQQIVESAIRAAHYGRIVSPMVTEGNLHLFRQYRNAVSPDPAHLVAAADEYAATLTQ